MALVEVRSLTKYFGGLAAVSELDIDIVDREILGLIGPNGAGKTTVFNLLTGYFPPTKGKVLFEGKDITGLKPYFIAARGIVRTFQLTLLFQEMTVLDNVLLGLHLPAKVGFWGSLVNSGPTRAREKSARDKALELLEFSGLSKLRNESAKNLPHGHQRALGVAIALAANPRVLLMDEPVTGMNVEEIAHMLELIKRIREQGTTVLVVEHNMKAVMGLCDRIVVMNFGKKIAEGSPSQVREDKAVIEAYLGAEGGQG